MSCEIDERDGVIRIRGEMTIYSAQSLGQQLLATVAAGTDQCRIDLSEVAEMDNSGIQILLMVRKVCAQRKRPLAFVSPSPAAAESLNLLRFEGAGG